MFSKRYPNIFWWIENQGWVEMGADDYSNSLVRIIDEGGICWEDKTSRDLDEALKNGEIWLSYEIQDRFGQEPPKIYED